MSRSEVCNAALAMMRALNAASLLDAAGRERYAADNGFASWRAMLASITDAATALDARLGSAL